MNASTLPQSRPADQAGLRAFPCARGEPQAARSASADHLSTVSSRALFQLQRLVFGPRRHVAGPFYSTSVRSSCLPFNGRGLGNCWQPLATEVLNAR